MSYLWEGRDMELGQIIRRVQLCNVLKFVVKQIHKY